MDKYQVVYRRNHLASLGTVTPLDKSLFHWDETLDAFVVEELLGDEFAPVGGVHRKPDGAVLLVHYDFRLLWLPLLPYGHTLGSSMVL